MRQRIRVAITNATERENLQETTNHPGSACFNSDPRVFVVASIAGGTGGGMVVDIGYAIRQTLAELGLSDDDAIGILAYGTVRGKKTHGLEITIPATSDAFK